MTIYIDVVFLENLFINYIILIGTGLVRKIKLKKMRLLISAFIGSIFSIIELIIAIPIIIRTIFKILISLIMILLAFNPQSVNKMLKAFIVFYLITFTTAGCVLGLTFLSSSKNISEYNGTITISHPYKLSIIASMIGFAIIQYSFKNNKKKMEMKDYICNLKVEICGKVIKTKAFIDSGNNLKDPLTMKPVIIIEQNILKNTFNIDNFKLFNSEGGDNKIKIRWIPYKSIGRNDGMLMGIKAENVEIELEGKNIKTNNVTVGIYNGKIDKNFSALVGTELLTNKNK